MAQCGVIDFHAVDLRPGCPKTDLENVILPLVRLTGEGVVAVVRNPFVRDISCHPDREFPVLREYDVILPRMPSKQPFFLSGSRDHLHRIKAVHLANSLKLDHFRLREARKFLGGKPVLLDPFGRGGLLEWRIFDSRICPAAAHHVTEIIHIVVSRNCLWLEYDPAALAAHIPTNNVSDPLSCRGVDHNNVLGAWLKITTTPLDVGENRFRGFFHTQDDPVIAKRIGIPLTCAVKIGGRHVLGKRWDG